MAVAMAAAMAKKNEGEPHTICNISQNQIKNHFLIEMSDILFFPAADVFICGTGGWNGRNGRYHAIN